MTRVGVAAGRLAVRRGEERYENQVWEKPPAEPDRGRRQKCGGGGGWQGELSFWSIL